MQIKLIAVGEKMPAWVKDGCAEYLKRLTSSNIKITIIETPVAKRTKNSNIKKLMEQEAKAILEKLSPSDYIIVLDPKGKLISTESLAEKIDCWQQYNPNIAIIIGGPDGIDINIKNMSKEKISLSKMTFPHPIVRVVLIEQIYRSWTILKRHPYHK